jgi:signal transduction histidine kinase
MLRVLACVTQEHDLRLVVLAGFICLFACFTAVSLFARAGGATSSVHRWVWLGLAAAITGCGVWATHFVAMLAYQPGLPLGYDISLTVLSVMVAITLTGVGFAVMLYRPNLALLGGAVAGAAIGAMHYIGMAAVYVPAVVHYDPLTTSLSVAIGIVLGAVAFALRARYPGLKGGICAALAFTIAICGLHFTAMSAVTLAPDPTIGTPAQVTSPEWLAVAVAAVTLMMIVLSLAGSVMDRHLAERNVREAERLRRYVAELEATRQMLEATTKSLTVALGQAEASNRAKSQFLAMMGHELRTPLNAVIGFSEMLTLEAYGPLGDERYRDYIASIRESGTHLLAVINDVLDFAKIDANRLTLDDAVIDIGELVAGCLRIVDASSIAAGLVMRPDAPPDLPRLSGDPLRLRQILLNLLFNAIKFTPAAGTVTVTAGVQEGRIVLSVSDTGIGIAPEDIPKAMERFGQVDSRLSRTYEGTGLGLPLAKQLMELHGGTLDLASEVGVGTTVTLTFPSQRTLMPNDDDEVVPVLAKAPVVRPSEAAA